MTDPVVKFLQETLVEDTQGRVACADLRLVLSNTFDIMIIKNLKRPIGPEIRKPNQHGVNGHETAFPLSGRDSRQNQQSRFLHECFGA